MRTRSLICGNKEFSDAVITTMLEPAETRAGCIRTINVSTPASCFDRQFEPGGNADPVQSTPKRPNFDSCGQHTTCSNGHRCSDSDVCSNSAGSDLLLCSTLLLPVLCMVSTGVIIICLGQRLARWRLWWLAWRWWLAFYADILIQIICRRMKNCSKFSQN